MGARWAGETLLALGCGLVLSWSALAQDAANAPQPAAPGPGERGGAPSLAPQVVPLVGKKVVSADGKEFGEVSNVLIGQDGNIRGVVVERGGLLGGKSVAIPATHLAFGEFEQRIIVNLPEDQLSHLPEFEID